MASVYGSTTKTGAGFIRTSKGSRPATSGNKRVSRARRQSAMAQNSKVAGTIRSNLAGPYLGKN